MKKFIRIVLLILILFGAYKGVKKYIHYRTAWKVQVTTEFINIREESTPYSNKLGEAKRSDVYEVVEKVIKNEYVWYKIILKDDEKHPYGWISSDRDVPSVKEINEKKGKEKEEVVSDSAKPIVKYDEDIYRTKDINSITYDHLKITDDSEYKITSAVYKENCPDYHQYWIQYTVTDKYNNKTVKTQAIAFEEEPADDLVKDLTEIRSKVCTGKQ